MANEGNAKKQLKESTTELGELVVEEILEQAIGGNVRIIAKTAEVGIDAIEAGAEIVGDVAGGIISGIGELFGD